MNSNKRDIAFDILSSDEISEIINRQMCILRMSPTEDRLDEILFKAACEKIGKINPKSKISHGR